MTACGGGSNSDNVDGGGSSSDNVDGFVGIYTYGPDAMQVLDCVDDQFDQTQIVTGLMFELALGTGSDLVQVVPPDAACPGFKFDVSGNVASAVPGQSCTATTAQGLTVMNAIDEYVVTLDDVGTAITVNANVTVTFSGSASTTCTIVFFGSATK